MFVSETSLDIPFAMRKPEALILNSTPGIRKITNMYFT